MTRWVVPGAESFSEFAGLPVHQYGDCGPDAVYMALHAISPAKYPLTGAGLGAIDAAEESGGYAAAGGAQDIVHMHEYLSHMSVPHHTYGYADFNLDLLHQQCKQYLSQHWLDVLVVEYSETGLGFPDDESAVRFHFNMICGEDDATPAYGYIGGYLRGDGDSRTDSQTGQPTPLILTPWPQIQRATPIAYIIIHNVAVQPVNTTNVVDAVPAGGSATPAQPQSQTPAGSAPGEYTVQSADLQGGWGGIADRFGVSLDELQTANAGRFINENVLTSGQLVVIPGR